MKNPFSKVLGLFAARTGSSPDPAAKTSSPAKTDVAPDVVPVQGGNSSTRGSPGALSCGCCGKSDTQKIPIIKL